MRSVLLVAAILSLGCGGDCLGTYLGGHFTDKEISALSEVLAAFSMAGIEEPCCTVVFIWSPDQRFKGTTWRKYRSGGIVPSNPLEGYKGISDQEAEMVWIRRFGEAEPHLHSLLVHELLHAAGFEHGEGMKEMERAIRRLINK